MPEGTTSTPRSLSDLGLGADFCPFYLLLCWQNPHLAHAKLRFCRLASGKNHQKSSGKAQTRQTPRIGVPIQFSLLGIRRHYPNEIFLRPVDILRLGRTKYSRPNLRCRHGESRPDFQSELKTETLQNPITGPRPDRYDQCVGMSFQAARKTRGGHYALFSALRLYSLFFGSGWFLTNVITLKEVTLQVNLKYG